MVSDSVAGQARIPHALRRLLLDALAVRDRYSDALRRGAGEVIEGTAVETTAGGAAKQAAGGQAPLPALPAGRKERAEAGPQAPSTADEGDWGAIGGVPRSGPTPLAPHPAPAEELAALSDRLEELLGRNPTHRPNQRLLRHLATERDALLTFLRVPGVEATNWRAEQAIRPAVVNRKSWGGNRSWRGARSQEVAMSVLRTARQQGVDPIELMAAAQREREPTVTGMLRIPARASPDELPRAA